MSYHFRHACCNEMYGQRPFAEVCRGLRDAGYEGIEIAPFTLAAQPADIKPARRKELREIMASEGVAFVGLHWLMVSPKGLQVTSPDAALREKSWRHIEELIGLCADLGDGGVMVFGSPKQRESTGGLSPKEAARNFIDGLAKIAPLAGERGVTILVEALPTNQCDVITSLAQAAEVVREIAHPAVCTMFDTHNAVEEAEPHATLIERYFDMIRHVHVNEMDGTQPGTGGYNFYPVLDTLARKNYAGWVSLEVFDFSYGPERIAAGSIDYLNKEIARIA